MMAADAKSASVECTEFDLKRPNLRMCHIREVPFLFCFYFLLPFLLNFLGGFVILCVELMHV